MIEGADPLKLPCVAGAPAQCCQYSMIEGAGPLKLPCVAGAPAQCCISKPKKPALKAGFFRSGRTGGAEIGFPANLSGK